MSDDAAFEPQAELVGAFGPDSSAPAAPSPALLEELLRKESEIAELRDSLARLRQRMAEDLRLAASVQRALLPLPRDVDGLDLAREFLPFREIGGDYYDVVELPGRRVALAIADVMGKGVPAALLVASLKSALRTQLRVDDRDVGELMGRVNRLFHEVTPRATFATFALAILDQADGRLDYVNAGHEYPLLLREDGTSEELARGGTVLGLLEEARYDSGTTELRPGDLLVLFTDGITDRENAAGEPYSAVRLKRAAARSVRDPARIALYTLLGDVQDWSAGCAPEDDATLMVVKRT